MKTETEIKAANAAFLVDGENIPVSMVKNIKGWNSVTVSNTIIDGVSNITARKEININTEFHASSTSEVHIFPSDAFTDCSTISAFARMTQNNSDNEKQAEAKAIEINFKKDLKPDVSIIPNPNSGLFTLEISNGDNQPAVILIKNLLGNELKKITAKEQLTTMDLHTLSKCNYFVEVVFKNSKIIKKLIIQ